MHCVLYSTKTVCTISTILVHLGQNLQCFLKVKDSLNIFYPTTLVHTIGYYFLAKKSKPHRTLMLVVYVYGEDLLMLFKSCMHSHKIRLFLYSNTCLKQPLKEDPPPPPKKK